MTVWPCKWYTGMFFCDCCWFRSLLWSEVRVGFISSTPCTLWLHISALVRRTFVKISPLFFASFSSSFRLHQNSEWTANIFLTQILNCTWLLSPCGQPQFVCSPSLLTVRNKGFNHLSLLLLYPMTNYDKITTVYFKDLAATYPENFTVGAAW